MQQHHWACQIHNEYFGGGLGGRVGVRQDSLADLNLAPNLSDTLWALGVVRGLCVWGGGRHWVCAEGGGIQLIGWRRGTRREFKRMRTHTSQRKTGSQKFMPPYPPRRCAAAAWLSGCSMTG